MKMFLFSVVPFCKSDKINVIGATKGESLEVICEIVTHPVARWAYQLKFSFFISSKRMCDAKTISPTPILYCSKFHWKFENSEDMIEVEHLKYINNGSSSILHFTPNSDHVSLLTLFPLASSLTALSFAGFRHIIVLGNKRDWNTSRTLHISNHSSR